MIAKVGGGSLLEVVGQDDGCITGGAVVDGEFGSGKVRRHCRIGLVQRSGGNAVLLFCMTAQTAGEAYSIDGGILWWRWRQKRKLVQMRSK